MLTSNLMSAIFATPEKAIPTKEIKTIIENYYNDSYDMWLNLKIGDLSPYLDLKSIQCYNKFTALNRSIDTWKYSIDKGYYKGKRQKHNINYKYISFKTIGNDIEVKVNLSGETSGMPAYPFFVSFGDNIFRLAKVNDKWVIYYHDYNDVFFYEKSRCEKLSYNIETLHTNIDKENTPNTENNSEELDFTIRSYPHTDHYYSSSRAVSYANKFVNTANSYFYTASLDCTNFVSQCISYGFGQSTSYSSSSSYRMVSGSYSNGWFAGSGGGSGPWESVSHHWNYMTSSKTNLDGPRVNSTSLSSLKNGDVMQIDLDSNGTYDHSVICVDTTNKKFAQHSYNGYRYYSQYEGIKRFYHPKYFRVYE